MSEDEPTVERLPPGDGGLSSFVRYGLLAVLIIGETVFADYLLSFHDLEHHHWPWRAWAANVWAAGEIPLWAPVGHGFPLLADGQIGALYPIHIGLWSLFSAQTAFALSVILHQIWGAVGGWYLARTLGRSDVACFTAGLAWGFSGFVSAHVVYLGMFEVLAWIPWMVAYGIRGTRFGGSWWGKAALCMGMAWLAGHPQLALYGTWALIFAVLWHAVPIRDRRGAWPLGGLVFTLVCGGVIAGGQLGAMLELTGHGLRAQGLSAAEGALGSLPPEELINLVIPDAFGMETPYEVPIAYHHRGPEYVGRSVSWWESCMYLGVPVTMLAIGAGRSRRARPWWILGGFGLLFALGPATPLWGVFRWFPGQGLLRFPVRGLVFVALAGSQLAAVGIDRLGGRLHGTPKKTLKGAGWWLAATLIALGIATAVHITVNSEWDRLHSVLVERLDDGAPDPTGLSPDARAERILDEIVTTTDPREPRLAWALWCVAAVLAVRLAAGRSIVTPGNAIRGLSGLVFLDLALFSLSQFPSSPAERLTERPPMAQQLLGQAGTDRYTTIGREVDVRLNRWVLSTSIGLPWGVEDVVVPSPLRLARNQRWATAVGVDLGPGDPSERRERLARHRPLLDLSGLRWLGSTDVVELPDLELAWSKELELDEEPVTVRLYENPRALPRAFVVGCAESVSSDEALDALLALEEPGARAITEGEGTEDCVPGRAGEVTVERPHTTRWDLVVEAEREGMVVLTESFYPFFTWIVDGQTVSPERVDYLFQGVRVGPGRHEIQVVYLPAHLYVLIGLGALMFSVVLGWTTLVRDK